MMVMMMALTDEFLWHELFFFFCNKLRMTESVASTKHRHFDDPAVKPGLKCLFMLSLFHTKQKSLFLLLFC